MHPPLSWCRLFLVFAVAALALGVGVTLHDVTRIGIEARNHVTTLGDGVTRHALCVTSVTSVTLSVTRYAVTRHGIRHGVTQSVTRELGDQRFEPIDPRLQPLKALSDRISQRLRVDRPAALRRHLMRDAHVSQAAR